MAVPALSQAVTRAVACRRRRGGALGRIHCDAESAVAIYGAAAAAEARRAPPASAAARRTAANQFLQGECRPYVPVLTNRLKARRFSAGLCT